MLVVREIAENETYSLPWQVSSLLGKTSEQTVIVQCKWEVRWMKGAERHSPSRQRESRKASPRK